MHHVAFVALYGPIPPFPTPFRWKNCQLPISSPSTRRHARSSRLLPSFAPPRFAATHYHRGLTLSAGPSSVRLDASNDFTGVISRELTSKTESTSSGECTLDTGNGSVNTERPGYVARLRTRSGCRLRSIICWVSKGQRSLYVGVTS